MGFFTGYRNEGKFYPYCAIDNSRGGKYFTTIEAISKELNINFNEFIKIILKFDRIIKSCGINRKFYFSHNSDYEKFLNSPELEPYLIMWKLTEA